MPKVDGEHRAYVPPNYKNQKFGSLMPLQNIYIYRHRRTSLGVTGGEGTWRVEVISVTPELSEDILRATLSKNGVLKQKYVIVMRKNQQQNLKVFTIHKFKMNIRVISRGHVKSHTAR